MSAVMPLPDDCLGEIFDEPCTATWQQEALELLPLYLSGGQVAELAARAAILEAAVSPKPGLVCLGSNGAHSDMDYPLFVRSAKALRPYFAQAHALGQSTHGLVPEQVFAPPQFLPRCAAQNFFLQRLRQSRKPSAPLQVDRPFCLHRRYLPSMRRTVPSAGE